ncbi:hypothetical protein [Sphingomonas sp. TREG-RG-20F-R18-01]|uniref:hypothetical protein n=1 Tax=Sphingomonas sp. TREG-RG-20F-R18-01 TaxID=2914982 RepID=UPI001F573073|nr:hypothetical protein [Sphingomonas sp. TREG-RG-20F-R18-01]
MEWVEQEVLVPDVVAALGPALNALEAELDLVASGLDKRFVDAGHSLAHAYDIVEKLIASLDRVTNALDREAADRAIATMQGNADRLARLPVVQADRQRSLDIIQQATSTVQDEVLRVDRTLDFLQICGRNIKVAAAGAPGYSDFADAMIAKLDVSEREMHQISKEVAQLAATVPCVVEVNRVLASECARLCPHVPDKLAADAIGLQNNQVDTADRADRIATVARDIRTKLSASHGAMQIGDITRQRLEHAAQICRILDAALADSDITPDSTAAAALMGQGLSLLAAQVADATQDFQHQSRLLATSFQSIGAQLAAMLLLSDEGAVERGSHAAFLEVLEQSVAEVDSVTARLRDADTRSTRLGAEASVTVERLGQRLTTIYRVTNDVQIMAWNTDLRSYRMGRAGDGLARIAAEIRGLVKTLESVSGSVATAFERLNSAAGAISSESESETPRDGTLETALDVIRAGAQLTREGMSGLDRHAVMIRDLVDEMIGAVECETVFSDPMLEIVARSEGLAKSCGQGDTLLTEQASRVLQDISRTYTMSSERQVHSGIVAVSSEQGFPVERTNDLVDCDGLF